MSKTLRSRYAQMVSQFSRRWRVSILILIIVFNIQFPSILGLPEEDFSLWQGTITVKNNFINDSWYLKGHDTGNMTSNWASAANKVSSLMSWNKTLAENFIMVFGNPYNNTLFVSLTNIDKLTVETIQQLLLEEKVNLKFIKGVASINKLNAWISELNPEELKNAGLPVVSCGKSVNGTIILTLSEITDETIDKLNSFIKNRVPPGVIIVGKSEVPTTTSERIRPLEGGIEVQTGLYEGNNTWAPIYSTLSYIFTSGNQKYALIVGHAIKSPEIPGGKWVYQPNLFISSDLIGTATVILSSGRYSDSAIIPLEGVSGINEVKLPSSSIPISGMIGYEQQYKGLPVEKMGITTGHTYGQIEDKWDWILDNTYGWLNNQIRATYSNNPGDSGGPVWTSIDGINYAVGLHTGKKNDFAYYSPIDGVERDFGLTFFDRINLVVRGSYPDIYIRNYITPYWYNYTNIPGATSDSPAATAYDGKLYIIVRAGDGYSLYFGNINRATGVFSGWTFINGTTPSAPTLTSGNGKLILVLRGRDNQIWYRIYTISTSTWGSWATLPTGSTSQSPGATVLNNKLHIVVNGYGSTSLWHSSLDLTSFTFSGWTQIEGGSQSSPTLTSYVTPWVENRVCLVVRGTNNNIYLNEWSEGSGWSENWRYLNGSTVYTVGAAVLNDSLYVACIGEDSGIYWARLSLLSYAFYGWTTLGGYTPFRPTLTSEGGR